MELVYNDRDTAILNKALHIVMVYIMVYTLPLHCILTQKLFEESEEVM